MESPTPRYESTAERIFSSEMSAVCGLSRVDKVYMCGVSRCRNPVTCVNMQADSRKTGGFLDAGYDGGDGNEVKTIVQESSEDHVAKDIR